MTLTESISTYVLYALAFPTAFWLVAYLIPQIYMSIIRPIPDLKARYPGASWALVTGSGSGIGRALSFKLASQGFNVVLVSLDDHHLRNTMKSLREMYPKSEFRSVGCNFVPNSDYLKLISDATSDIDVRCVFNNAGFIVTGFVDQAPLSKLLSNVECNATASFAIAHHFLNKMVSKSQTGCIVFTSSVAGFIPTPFAASYAATKAFVSQLACSLHIEVKGLGIDVCAVHPSPVSSNFYEKVSSVEY
jgi:short-subunit dehydrogenase